MSFFKQLFGNNSSSNTSENVPLAENSQGSTTMTEVLCQTWRKLDADILEPYLDESFKYNSVWVGSTLNGKNDYLKYLRGKFDTFKKTDSCPMIDVIKENGVELPHFVQGEVEGVLDYQQKEGKFTSILMRPLMKIKIVDDSEWVSYAQAYHDFLPKAVQIAGQAIQNYANERGLEFPKFTWLQMHPNHPSFQHLCFRKGTQVYSILIALHGFSSEDGKDDNNIVVYKKDYDLLLEEAEKNNLIPCLFPVSGIPQIPMLANGLLLNAQTEESIRLDDEAEKGSYMSAWELNNMGIFTVMDYLRKQGYSKISYCDVVGINPQIFFEKDGKNAFVIVRSIPIGLRNNLFEVNNNMLKKLEGYEAYFADVQYAHVHNNGDFEDKALWRGDGYYCNFTGLQELGKAIADNSFIICVDKENYDIK